MKALVYGMSDLIALQIGRSTPGIFMKKHRYFKRMLFNVIFNKSFTKNIKNLRFSIDGQPIEMKKSYCYLGIEISNTGSFSKALDTLYKKSLRALYSVYASLNIYSDGNSMSLFLKLFDSLVKPVLLYGSEIWGYVALNSMNNQLDKMVNKFYRTLLGVPNNCSTIGTHVELGRFPISIDIKYNMVKYWCRLATLPKSRLVSNCYWSLYSIKNGKDKWIISIKETIESTGQYNFNFLWKSQTALQQINPKLIAKCRLQTLDSLKQQFLGTAVDKME